MSEYYFGQGRIFTSVRNADGSIAGWKPVGNAPTLTINFGQEVLEHRESMTGFRGVDKRINLDNSLSFSMVLEEVTLSNLRLMVFGVTSPVAGSSVVDEELPPLLADEVFHLQNTGRVSAVTVTDSAATPVDAGDYSIDTGGVGSFSSVDGYVQPFLVSYTNAAGAHTPMFTAAQPERAVLFDGINLAELNEAGEYKRVQVWIYRGSFSPPEGLDLINQDALAQFTINGSGLLDTTKPAGGELGQFGNIISLDPEDEAAEIGS